MKEELSTFIDVNDNRPPSTGKIIYAYRYNGYRMLLAGLFTAEEKIGIHYKFANSIDQIQVRLRFLSIINDHLLIIQTNEKIIYSRQFAESSDLGGEYIMQYANQSKEQVKAFLKLYALEASTANSIMNSVDTGIKEVIAKELTVSFHVRTNNII